MIELVGRGSTSNVHSLYLVGTSNCLKKSWGMRCCMRQAFAAAKVLENYSLRSKSHARCTRNFLMFSGQLHDEKLSGKLLPPITG